MSRAGARGAAVSSAHRRFVTIPIGPLRASAHRRPRPLMRGAICDTAPPMEEPSAGEHPGPPAQGRPQVLYVMGAGRSGSTILGVTLGNCKGVFYAGELDAWLARSGEPQLVDPERTRFWDAVRARVDGAQGLYGHDAQRAIERSLAIFRVSRWRARRRLRGPYRRVAESLYRAIAAEASTSFIVDTSHYPLRARELQAVPGIDLYLFYLVRDPQSVVASFRNREVAQYSKSTLTTNVYLWLTNLLAALVFLRQPRGRRMFVRYEDFLADPESAVRELLACAGAAAGAPDFDALQTGVAFQGNRLIREKQITLKADPAAVRRGHSALSALLQLPWAIVFSRLQPRVTGSGGASAH
jgi:Sulfotransferase family